MLPWHFVLVSIGSNITRFIGIATMMEIYDTGCYTSQTLSTYFFKRVLLSVVLGFIGLQVVGNPTQTVKQKRVYILFYIYSCI